MDIAVYNQAGKADGKLSLDEKVFGVRMNRDLVWQVATSLMSNARQVLAHTKTRSEVSGGGKKPWRQKGTGRARHGSIRSPIWVGGGVAHGPTKDVNFKKKINRAQGKAALAVVLSDRVRTGSLMLVDSLQLSSGKTKDAVAALTKLAKGFPTWKTGDRILLVLPGTSDDTGIRRATANLSYIQTMRAQDLNALAVLSVPFVIAVSDAIAAVEKTFMKKNS